MEPLPSKEECIAAARKFGIDAAVLRNDILLAGSPERSAFRTAVQDTNNQLYVLESIFLQAIVRKERIADNLDFLKIQGVEKIVPYIPLPGHAQSNHTHVLHSGNRYWLLSSHVDGRELERPGYAFEKWRGKAMADFLLALKTAQQSLSIEKKEDFFSLPSYISGIISDIRKNDPRVLDWFLPFFQHLQTSFFPCHDELPRHFCHGDFHPMNIIWGDTDIRAVIDWEFSGIKPEGYDLANLLGCLGMEHPQALTGELVLSCVRTLRGNDFLSAKSWDNLPDFILAIRFAWLSEWLRRKDIEMIEMEKNYMGIILDNASGLKNIWGI